MLPKFYSMWFNYSLILHPIQVMVVSTQMFDMIFT
jgi:uncharacterized membrane protein YhdT